MFNSILHNWEMIDNTVDPIDNRNEDVRSLFEQIRLDELKGIIKILEVF
jgi:hypothetical protein